MCPEEYELPKSKEALLTDGFLKTFKYEVEKVYEDRLVDNTYFDFYCYVVSTLGFYRALKEACKKHNVEEEIYNYAQGMEWYDSDIFDIYLIDMMLERGIIEEGEY